MARPKAADDAVMIQCPKCNNGLPSEPVPWSRVTQGPYGNCGICGRQMRRVVRQPRPVAVTMLEALKTTRENIRSIGPAGAIGLYLPWLRVVEDAIAIAEEVARLRADAVNPCYDVDTRRECLRQANEIEGCNPAAFAIGALGGVVKSKQKTASSRKNGTKGGRPKNQPAQPRA